MPTTISQAEIRERKALADQATTVLDSLVRALLTSGTFPVAAMVAALAEVYSRMSRALVLAAMEQYGMKGRSQAVELLTALRDEQTKHLNGIILSTAMSPKADAN